MASKKKKKNLFEKIAQKLDTSALKDGYDVGDISKVILGTAKKNISKKINDDLGNDILPFKQKQNKKYDGGILTNALSNQVKGKNSLLGELMGGKLNPGGALIGNTINEGLKMANINKNVNSNNKAKKEKNKNDIAPVLETKNTTINQNGNISLKNQVDSKYTIAKKQIKEQSNKSYNELQKYKKEHGINLFNENSKRVKNDKKYQKLLKNAQKDVIDSQKARQKEFVNNLEFDEGITGGIEKTGMALAGGVSTGVSGLESTAKKILGQTPSIEENELKYGMFNDLFNKAIDETDSKIGKAGLNITNSIGQMIPQIAIGNPIGSTITGFANYGGSAYNEAKKNGATEEQATKYGIISGTLEMTMEKALGGFESVYGKSMSGKFTNNVMNKLIKNKALRKTLTSMKGEFTEEYLQEFLEPILKNAILDEKNGADFWNTMKDDIGAGIRQLGGQFFNKENLYAGTLGMATSGLVEGPQNIARNNWSKQTGRDFDTGYTQNEQKVLDELVNREISKKSKEQAINTEIENTIKNQSIMLSEENKQKIADRIRKEYEDKDIDISNTKLSEKETKKIKESIEKQLLDGSIDTNEITNILGEETDFSKDNYLQKSFYEKSQRSNNYQYEENQNDSEITKALKQSASRVMNNTTKSRNFVDNVMKIAEDKGTRYEFVNNEQLEQMGYDINGKDINGLVGKDSQGNEKVLINIDSKTSLNKIVGHETTHLLEGTEEYTSLQNTIKEYAKSKSDYDNRIKSMEQLYSGLDANIENEVTSDLVGEYLFNDEEFINHLSRTEPNVFTKIYDYIKHLYKTITADSQQAKDLEKVKYRFEQAYKQNLKNKSVQNTKYSIQTDKKGNKYVNVDTDQNIFEGKNLYEQNKIAKQYILDNFRNKELFIGNNNVSITRTTANEYTHPKTTLQKKDASSKMKASTELDNLLSISEYKYSKPDDGRHSFAKDGWDYYETTFKVGNNIYTGLVNIAKNGNKKMLYDITNLKRNTLISSPVNTATESIGIPFSDNNIPQSTENVNSDISNNSISNNSKNDTKELDNSSFFDEKYSLSNNEEFIDLEKKAKQYDALNETNYIEYFKKENGDVKVYLMDSNNNLVNDLSLWSNTNAISEFGEKLGNKIYETATDSNQRININKDINNIGTETDYFMNHRPSEDYGNASNFEENMPDIFEHPEWYIDLNEKYNKESLNSLRKVRNNPNAEITIYRATIGNKINVGDWVTPSRSYAEYHNNSQFDGKANVLEMKVKAKDIKFAGDDINEFGYFPSNNIKYSLSESNKNINDKVERALQKSSYKAMNIARKVANSYLDFDYQQKKSFKEQLSKFSGMTKEELTNVNTYKEIRNIVNQYANKEYKYVDDQVESIKAQIKKSKIMINDYLKRQITDYSDFRKQSKLKLGKEGQPIDSLYQELSNAYPYYFSDDIIAEADMLYELSDFMNQDFTATEKYRIPDEDLKYYSDKIFNKLIDNSISQDDINELQQQLEKKAERRTRQVVRQELLEKMNLKIEDFEIGNDIGNIEYQRTDPVRVNEKVFGYQMGTKINDATINFTKHQEAERTRWLNKERDDIKSLGIKARSKESSAVQKYGEGFYINDNGEKIEYTDSDLENEFSNPRTREKIKYASKIIRSKYDSYIEQINTTLTKLGYDEIPKRKDYFRHFEELTDKLSQWGVPFNRNDMMAEDLPTDINGLTGMNKPGKNYFASANQRTGLKTIYDAITGIDGYLEGASNLIFHTESIQRYRAVTRLVRESYGREHGLDDSDLLTDEELQQRIDNIRGNKLSRYVAWLDEQANALAGKKGAIDRGIERVLGRKIYTALNTIKSQVGSNMIGFNLRTPLTNIASVIQGASKTEKVAFLKGTVSTINNIFYKDDLIDKSDFLTSRFGSDMLSKKAWQKVANAGQIFMTASDYFTANQVWRSKYYENLSKGMTEDASIKNADDFSAKVMGDRTKGATAEMFNSKTLGFLTQFQLETNNQWSSMIHDNKMAKENGEKTTAGIIFNLGQLFVCSHLFNMFMENIGAGEVMLDPIEMLMKLFDPDDDKPIEDRIAEVRDDLIGQIPMGNILSENGRFPISEALPIKQLLYGKDKNGNDKSRMETLLETLPYYLLPGGYSQIKKFVKGLSMYDDKLPVPGSYTKSGNLRFTADESLSGKIKAGLFGQYSSESAQDYIDSGFKSINKSKIDEMKDLNMNSTEYRNYRDGLSKAGTKNSDKLDYINNLDVSNDKKNIMASGLLKKDIDMSNYNKYSSYEEFNYSIKNPEKYKMITSITDYDNYKNIMKNIKNIDSDLDKNGKVISGSKMKKVISYVNSLNLSIPQKAMLIKQQYPSFKTYDKQIYQYVNSKNLDFMSKASIMKQMGFKQFDKQILSYVKKHYSTQEEQEKILEKMGFTIYTYNGKTYVKG